jgi:CheY-like chemotaxis protein
MPPETLKILLVEDDEPKLSAISDFLAASYDSVELTTARSLSSGMSILDKEKFDMAILDMSLPTYDLARDKAGGGEPQGFGGRDLLRLIEAESPSTLAVVITQYPNFEASSRSGSKTLDELGQELKSEFGDQFLGIVYYSGKQGRWRSELRAHIDNLQALK